MASKLASAVVAAMSLAFACSKVDDTGSPPKQTDENTTSSSARPGHAGDTTSSLVDGGQAYPVPVRATPSEYVQPGSPVNLQPASDCIHPDVQANCTDGFCTIQPGCFIMGSPRDRPGAGVYADVQVQVTLTHAFELGEAEVTNREWLEAGFDLPLRDVDIARCDDAECPISNINFYETLTFLNRYSELRGLNPCYDLRDCEGTFGSGPVCNRLDGEHLTCQRTDEDGLACDGAFLNEDTPYLCDGYRLPTEAEWEYAARGGTSWATSLGNVAWQDPTAGCVGPNPNLDPLAWYCWNSGKVNHPRKQRRANPWGLHDILGNVSEWTNTTLSYGGYGVGPLVDPVGYWYDNFGYADRNLFPTVLDEGALTRQDNPTMRGGNSLFDAVSCTTEKRSIFAEAFQGASVIGFRIARTIF